LRRTAALNPTCAPRYLSGKFWLAPRTSDGVVPWLRDEMRGVRISVRARDFSLLQNDQNGSGATKSLVELVTGRWAASVDARNARTCNFTLHML
jgi:hypothetical protein